jgi:MoxR-like ATPase
LPDGRTVAPAKGFQVIATSNYNPDETLDRALRDRFSTCINVTDVAPGALAALEPELRTMAKRFTLDPDVNRRMSVRRFFAFQRLRKANGGSPDLAAQAVFGKGGQDILDSLALKKAEK